MKMLFEIRLQQFIFKAFLFCTIAINALAQNLSHQDTNVLLENAKALRTANPDSCLILATQLHKLSENPDEQAYAAYLAGYSYYRLGQYDTAYYLLDEAVDAIGGDIERGIALTTLGRIFRKQDNFARAEDYFNRALDHFESIEAHFNIFYTLNDLGISYYTKGDYNQALDYYLMAKNKALDFGMENRVVRLLNNIIGVYTMLNKNDKAFEMAQEAIEIASITKDPVDLKTAFNAMGYVHMKTDNLDSAIIYSEKALIAAREADDFYSLSWQYLDQGDIYALKNENKKALSAYNNALSLLERDNISEDADIIRMKMAEIYLDENQYDSALLFARQSYQSGLTSGSKWPLYKASELMANTYVRLNEPEKASQHFQNALAYKDSINNDKTQQQFADQRVKLETLEKVKTIDSLKKQAQIDQLQRERLTILIIALLIVSLLVFFLLRQRFKSKQRIQEEINSQLEAAVQKANEDLNTQTLHMMHMNNALTELETELKSTPQEKMTHQVQQVLKKINLSKNQQRDWEEFDKYFGHVHNHFFEHLASISDKLTLHEKRICALIKMNLSNHEIATLLNIETKSVKMVKYRIKKKLDLDKDTDLTRFIHELETGVPA